MPDFTLKLLDIGGQIVVGILVGIVTYLASSRLKSLPVRKDAMLHTLNDVILPITKITMLKANNENDIVHQINCIKAIQNNYPFDIPKLHRAKVNRILNLIEKYEKSNDNNKHLVGKKIKSEYNSYKEMIYLQTNMLKKQLGYPYDSFFEFLRYKTGSPYLMSFTFAYVVLMWLIVYIYFFLIGNSFAAFLVIAIPPLLFMIIIALWEFIQRKGGIRICIRYLAEKIRRKRNK